MESFGVVERTRSVMRFLATEGSLLTPFIALSIGLGGCRSFSWQGKEFSATKVVNTGTQIGEGKSGVVTKADLFAIYPFPKNYDELKARDYVSADDLFGSFPGGKEIFLASVKHAINAGNLGGNDDRSEVLGEASDECLFNPKLWLVSQARMAPYSIEIPGSPAVLRAWGEQRGSSLAKMVQIRFTLRPVCVTRFSSPPVTQIRLDDVAMHVVINPQPDDKILAERTFGPIRFFQNRDFSDSAATQVMLSSYLNAIDSSEYLAFRSSLISEWLKLAKSTSAGRDLTRLVADIDPDVVSDSTVGDATTNEKASWISPDLWVKSAYSASLRTYILTSIKSAADIRNIALMFTKHNIAAGSLTRWVFSNVSPKPYSSQNPKAFEELSESQKEIYSLVTPLRLDTHGARVRGATYELVPLTIGNSAFGSFYDEEFGRNRKHIFPSDQRQIFEAVDFVGDGLADVVEGPGGLEVNLPFERMDVTSNQFQSNAFSTGCTTCHTPFRKEGAAGKALTHPYDVHLLGWGESSKPRFARRTTIELQQEAVGLTFETNKNALLAVGLSESKIWACMNDLVKVRTVSVCLDKTISLGCLEACK